MSTPPTEFEALRADVRRLQLRVSDLERKMGARPVSVGPPIRRDLPVSEDVNVRPSDTEARDR